MDYLERCFDTPTTSQGLSLVALRERPRRGHLSEFFAEGFGALGLGVGGAGLVVEVALAADFGVLEVVGPGAGVERTRPSRISQRVTSTTDFGASAAKTPRSFGSNGRMSSMSLEAARRITTASGSVLGFCW